MRRQIFDFIDAKDADVIEVLFPDGRTIAGNWYEDCILNAYVNREYNNAKFYIQDDDTLWDIKLEGFGMMKVSAYALSAIYLYVCETRKVYCNLTLYALAGKCDRICDTIDKFLKERGYC